MSKMWAVALPICVATQPFARNKPSALTRQSAEREGWKIAPVARKRIVTRLESKSTWTTGSIPGEKDEIPEFERLPSAKEVISREPLSAGTAIKEFRPPSDLEYLQELMAIQTSGPKDIGFFGTRNMGIVQQQLVETLSYAMVLTGNHIFTSGSTGTNAAVIRGAMRAEEPDLLTVVLPQSLEKQPPESQELLKKVQNLVTKPENDHLSLMEASRICNNDIIQRVSQIICFAFHDSSLLMETCREAQKERKIVSLFYLD